MLRLWLVLSLTLAMSGLTACDDTQFKSAWRDPAIYRTNLRGREVAAVLLSSNEGIRRPFERDLASELRKYGVEAIPGYQLVPTTMTDKEDVVARLAEENVDYAIIMRMLGVEHETHFIPGSGFYSPYFYDPLWYGGRWGFPYYDTGYYVTDTLVSLETTLQAVSADRVLFTGVSRTLNPSEVDEFVEDVVEAAAKEMRMPALRDASD